MSHLLDTGLFVLGFARNATTGYLGGIEGEAFVKKFSDDGSNAAYIVGHIASTDDITLKMLAGTECRLTEAQQKQFGGGAEPTDNLADYPSQTELIAVMNERRQTLIGYFTGLSDDELTAPVEGPIAQFGDTRAKLMVSLAWHEAMHAGQLTVLRRQFDLPRVFG